MALLRRGVIFVFLCVGGALAARTTVTNEDIRDAILQVVNVVRSTEDKLERHEYRERVLGENLKKGLISIDKRIKTLEPFKGTISRLDQRLAAVETILMQKDERERIQLQKTFEAVEDIQKNLPLIVDKLKSDIIDKLSGLKSAASAGDLDALRKELGGKIDHLDDSLKSLDRDLGQIKDENRHLKDINNRSAENLDKVKRQLDSSEQLLEKYENKLAEYNNRIPEVVPHKSSDLQALLQAMEVQKNNVEQVMSDVKSVNSKIDKIPTKEHLDDHHNSTLGAFNGAPLPDPLTAEALKAISQDLRNMDDKFTSSYKGIKDEIENLGKVEAVMVQTADSVLDTKRRVEYGVHQIIAEMKKLAKENSKDINEMIGERFDTFEMSILDEDSGALANLTAKIGQELDQVWRQIGIMHQQMTVSGDTLTKLQNQTDAYVNGSLNTMDNMKGKVGTITSRISEVDDNLNYLMGKLSLVTQEFNQIKSGLGKALDEMKNTYKTVKDKIKAGPGPHKIESSEVEAA